MGPDSGYCHRLTAASAGTPLWLEFDVRQIWSAQSDRAGYPLDRRLVQQVTLAGSHLAGARWLRLRETGAVVGGADQIGRFVRCSGSQRAYVIASVVDDPAGDALLLADARGLPHAEPDGARCHVDGGWSRGDLAFVMAPVHVTTNARAAGQGFLHLQGDVTLRGVVLDGLGGGGTRGGLWIDGGRLLEATHIWMMDPLTSNGLTVTLEDVQCGATVDHLTVTGGPEAAEDDKNYGLGFFGGPSCTYYVNHLYTRYTGDDVLVTESTGASPTGALALRWIQGGPASSPGDSGQFLDFGTGNVTNVSAADALCTACTSEDGFGSLVIPSGGGRGLIERVLWLGATGQGFSANAASVSNPEFRYRDVGVIGSAVDPGQVPIGQLVGLDTERFYVRDVVDPRSQSLQLCLANPPAAARRLVQGLFADVSLGGESCVLTGDAELREIALVDVARAGARGPLIHVDAAAQGVVLQQLTTAFRRPAEGIAHAVALPYTIVAGAVAIDRLLVTGLGGESDSAMALRTPEVAAAVSWGGSSCFSDVSMIDAPEVLAAYGAPPLLLPDAGFEDVVSLRVAPAPGSAAADAGCGALVAGVTTVDWAHRKLRLLPTSISGAPQPVACDDGIDNDGDGRTDLDDFDCEASTDPDERAATPACGDDRDGDGDGLVDLEDPGCADSLDVDERDPALPCDDGTDNDGDGRMDHAAADGGDLSCTSVWSTESPPCQDGLDNDGQPASTSTAVRPSTSTTTASSTRSSTRRRLRSEQPTPNARGSRGGGARRPPAVSGSSSPPSRPYWRASRGRGTHRSRAFGRSARSAPCHAAASGPWRRTRARCRRSPPPSPSRRASCLAARRCRSVPRRSRRPPGCRSSSRCPGAGSPRRPWRRTR